MQQRFISKIIAIILSVVLISNISAVTYAEEYKEIEVETPVIYSEDELIVTFNEETNEKDIEELLDGVSESYEVLIGDEIEIDENLPASKRERLQKFKESYKAKKIIKVNLGSKESTDEVIQQFEEYDCVEDAEKNYCMENSTVLTNDTFSADQWYLDKINIKQAWNQSPRLHKSDIWIAVLDSGVDIQQEDLKEKYIEEYSVDVSLQKEDGSYVLLTETWEPYDLVHGTLVAGIVSAKSNNSVGIAGVATGYKDNACSLMAVKVTEENKYYSDNIAKGIIHAVNSGAEVINMSFGGAQVSDAVEEAVKYAEAAGVVVVAAAGNYNNDTVMYPAGFKTVISVGATTSDNVKSSTSSYGKWIDIVAPGENIMTTSIFNFYYCSDGTSLSAPMVAATAGLMLSVNPNLTPKQIRKYLSKTALDIGKKGKDNIYGNGLLDAGKAVTMARIKGLKENYKKGWKAFEKVWKLFQKQQHFINKK